MDEATSSWSSGGCVSHPRSMTYGHIIAGARQEEGLQNILDFKKTLLFSNWGYKKCFPTCSLLLAKVKRVFFYCF